MDIKSVLDKIEAEFNTSGQAPGIIVSLIEPDLGQNFIGAIFYKAADAELSTSGVVEAALGKAQSVPENIACELFKKITHATSMEARIN